MLHEICRSLQSPSTAIGRILTVCLVPMIVCNAGILPPRLSAQDSASVATPTPAAPATSEPIPDPIPWEYKPYNIRLWMTTDNSRRLEQIDFLKNLQLNVDREVQGAWELNYVATPRRFAGALARDFDRISYELFAGEDLILIVNGNSEVGRPIRTPKLAAGLPHLVPTTALIAQGMADAKDEGVQELFKRLEIVEDVEAGMIQRWIKNEIYAMVISRDMLPVLAKRMPPNSPQPRVIDLPIADQFIDIANEIDKLMMLRVTTTKFPMTVEAVEIDGLLRTVGPVVTETATGIDELPIAASRAMFRAFAPLVRIETGAAKTATGRVRARGLLRYPESTAAIKVGETLQPWIRKDDRNGRPQTLGILDWTYGVVKTLDGPKLEMDVFSGRSGGLAGKQSKRMQRVALRVRPQETPSVLRLHARGKPDSPMAGYEVYEKDVKSGIMTLVGRTNWDGRYTVQHTETPVRLLYIKNGGSVLARLPMVPGQMKLETADLIGDDTRLRAEAYLKGVENSIIDLVAQRQLLAARIRARIQKKQIPQARELFEELRKLPGYKEISDDMNDKQISIVSSNSVEQKKIDVMFAKTRELLVAQITDKLINDLQKEVAEAEGGTTS